MSENLRIVIVLTIILLITPTSMYADLYGRQDPADGFVWYRICGDDGQEGAKDTDGHILIPAIYDEVTYHTTDGGWFKVEKDNKYGVYTRAGKMLCDAIYDGATYNKSNDGIWVEIKKDGGTGVMDESGKIIIWPDSIYNDGLTYVDKEGFIYNDPFRGLIYKILLLTNDNPEAKEKPKVRPGRQEGADGFVYYFIQDSDGRWGAEDEEGNVLVPTKYTFYYRCKNYFKVINRRDDDRSKFKFGFYTIAGKMICDAIYDYAAYNRSEDGDWIEIRQDGAIGVLDVSGNFVVPLKKNKMYKGMGYDTKTGFYYKGSRGRKFPTGIFLKDNNGASTEIRDDSDQP